MAYAAQGRCRRRKLSFFLSTALSMWPVPLRRNSCSSYLSTRELRFVVYLKAYFCSVVIIPSDDNNVSSDV